MTTTDSMEFHDLLVGFVRIHILHHAAEGEVYGQWLIEELARHGYRISPGTPLSDASSHGGAWLPHLAGGFGGTVGAPPQSLQRDPGRPARPGCCTRATARID